MTNASSTAGQFAEGVQGAALLPGGHSDVSYHLEVTGVDGTWVMAECYQNGTVVYRQYVKVDPATHQATLTLGPTPSWYSGAASCRAEEGIWCKGSRWRVLATTTFNVSG